MNKNCVYFESNQHLSSVTFSPSNKDSLGTIYKDIEECITTFIESSLSNLLSVQCESGAPGPRC